MTSLIEELNALLNQVCEGKQATTTADVIKLEDSLFLNKKRMLNLLDDLPKKAEHRTLIQSGKAIINGKEYRLNEDFIKQTLFLSDQLNLDEYESARLLLEGVSQSSAMNSTGLDTAVFLYHSERGYVLSILNVILEAAKDASLDNKIRIVFVNFIEDIVKEKTSTGSFVSRIVQSTRDLTTMINSITKIGMLESAKSIQLNQQQQLQQQQQQQMQQQPLMQQQQQHMLNTNLQQSTANQLSFRPETANLRIDRLNEERILLAQILYHIASLHWLPEDDLLVILTKVQSINLADSIASYILTALLSAISFDCSYPGGRQGIDFSNNDAFLKKVHGQITNESWKVNTLKAVVSIQWSLFISIISKTRPAVDQAISFDKKQRTDVVKSAIALDAFGFMNSYLLYFKQKEEYGVDKKKMISDVSDDDSAMALDGLIVDPNDYTKFNVDISTDFQQFVVHELEFLTQSFILNMSEIFKDLKSKALENQVNQQPDSNSNEEIKNSLTKFLTLLSSIYRDRMNAGLKFWNNQNIGLYSFLGFLVDFKVPECLSATFDFFGSISTGVESAAHAHVMMKIGTDNETIGNSNLFSWGKLFSALQFFSNCLQKNTTEGDPPAFPAHEEESLCKFLYLCQQVVQYSNEARLEIWSNGLLAAHESIVAMISSHTSNRLRTALYDLLAAFCSNWGGGINGIGRRIALDVWRTLEFSDIVISQKVMVTQPTKPAAATPSVIQPTVSSLFNEYIFPQKQLPLPDAVKKPAVRQLYLPEQPVGFLREFEEEMTTKFYSQTLSILHLLASLIHAPSKRDELIAGFSLLPSSVPSLLGHDNHRTPGTAPYLSLVIDHVFLNIKSLKFVHPETRWRLTEACLTIIENSIMAFNIEGLVDHINACNLDARASIVRYSEALQGRNPESLNASDSVLQSGLLAFVTQPGYDILVRILSGGALIHELFKIVEMGKDAVSKSQNEKSDHFRRSMVRCLRIFTKVYKLQNAFVNVVIPQLNITAKKEAMGNFRLGQYTFPSPPSFRSLGTLMLYNTEVIVQIALMVNCDAYEDICYLSALVLADLASQPEDNTNDVKFPNHINVPMGGIGSKLAGILMSSPSASSIILSFSERLEIERTDVITYDDYEYDMNIIPFWLAEKTMENIYRFDEFDDYSKQTVSLRIAILDMLLDNMSKEIKSPTITEFLLGFDVKQLELSGSQLKSLPADVKHRSQLACLLFVLNLLNTGIDDDDSEEQPLIRTHPVLAEKCYQLIFKLCVRESTSSATLHYLRNNTDRFLVKQFEAIACRLETCVQVSEPYFEGTLESADKNKVATDYYTMVSVLNQRAWLLKLVALELHKTSPKGAGTLDLLELLYGLSDNKNYNTEDMFVKQMENMKLQLDSNYQQPLWNMLEIVNSLEFTWIDGMDEGPTEPSVYYKDFKENDYVIQKDGYVLYDIRSIYKRLRWKETTNPVAATFSDSERNAMETEMGNILKRLMAENRYREISYARLHCLRAWKQVVEVTISDCFDLFSFESREKIIYDLLSVLLPKLENGAGLHVEILKGLSEVTLSLLTRLRVDKRRQSILQIASAATESRLPDEKLRAVFNSIVNCIRKDKTTIEVRSAMYSALVNLLQYISPNDDVSDEGLSGNISAQVVEIIVGEPKHKLFETICNDASQGLEMYKTPAYMVLEALYVLVSKNNSKAINSYLVDKNFLRYTIDMIKRSDSELCKMIQERDASLIPLYNHEAKFTLFKQIAIRREGTALLLSNGILNGLMNRNFINTSFSRSELEEVETIYKVERHSRLLVPILELVNVLLARSEAQGIESYGFLRWIKRQDVLVSILTDDNAQTTLSSLYILQLTVSLLYQLSNCSDYFVSMEENGLDKHDSLLMSLIPKYCIPKDWSSIVVPSTLEERTWDKRTVPETAGGHGSLLLTKADKYITDISKNLLAYAEASTFRRLPNPKKEFKPIFANTLVPIKEYISATTRRASPLNASLSTLVGCLSLTGKQLSKEIAEFSILCAQKENVVSLKYEEILEIANTAIPQGLGIKYDSLNPSQQSQVLTTEINHRIKLKLKEIRDLTFIIENAVFILWRHLEFYLGNSVSAKATISPCERYANETVVLLQQALYQTSPSVITQLKSACHSVLEPVIQKLETLPTIHSSDTLIEMYTRLRRCYN